MEMESWVAEMAVQELATLEANHPHRFDLLKLELKSIISESNHNLGPSFSAATQESSSEKNWKTKRRRDGGGLVERADAAIERAENCLKRIRQVKRSFFC